MSFLKKGIFGRIFAFLEIKALWNATEMACGYYMLGADGLSEKIRHSIDCKKVGYTEVFSRFGKRFGQVIPAGKEESKSLMNTTAAMIIKANAPKNEDVSKLLKSTLGEDGIGNICLLHSTPNRSYGNELYTRKRYTIIQQTKDGEYIRPHTLNAFDKGFSKNPDDNLDKWDNNDIKENAKYIKKQITKFLNQD